MTDGTNSDRTPVPSHRNSDLTYELDPDERPSRAVIRAVASVTNTAVIDLEPLYDVVDTDHLDGVFEEASAESAVRESSVTIDYGGCRITVTESAIHVRDRGTDDE